VFGTECLIAAGADPLNVLHGCAGVALAGAAARRPALRQVLL
jgi:hypothetical protein